MATSKGGRPERPGLCFLNYYFQRLGADGQGQSAGGLDSRRERRRTRSNTTTFFFLKYCDRPLPSFTNTKEYHTHPGPVASHDATPRAFSSRTFPHGDGELHEKNPPRNPPTPCLWQAPASTPAPRKPKEKPGGFPNDVSRTERGLVRTQRGAGLPRGQFPGPWPLAL